MKKLKMMISLFITILSVFYLSSCIRKDIEPKVYMFNPEVDFSTINFDLKVVEPEEILIKEIYIKLYKENELETTLSSQDGINIVGTTEDIKFQMLVPQTQYKIEFSFDYLVGKYNDEDIVVYSYGFVTPENKPGVSGQILDDYFSAASVTFNVAYADENDLTKDFNIYLKQGDKLIDSLTIYKGNGLRVGCTFGPLPPNENYTILLCATFEYEGKQYEDLILDKIEYDTNNYTYVFYPTANFSNIRLNEDVITFNLSLQSRYCMITNLIVVLVDAKENIIAQLSLEDDLRIGKNENCKFDGLYPSKSYTIQVIADYQSKYEEYKDVVLAEYKFKTTAFAPTPTAEISNVFVKDDVVTFNSTLTDTYHLLIDYSLVLLDSNDVIIEKLSKSERLILGTHAWIFDLLKPNSEYKIAILGSYEYKGQYILDEELTVQTFKTGNYTLLPSAKIEDYYCKGAELNIGYTLSDPYNMITDYSLVLLDPNDVVLEKHSISDIELGGMCYDTFNLFLPDTSYKIQLLVNYKYRDKTEVYITQEIFKTDVQSYLPSVTITRINLVEDKIDFEYSVSDTYSLLSSLRCEIMGEDYAFSKMIDLKDKMSNGYHTITVRIGKNITNFDIQLIADYSYHIYEKNNEIMDSIEVFENSQEDFEYYIYDAGVTITKYIGESSTCVIPKVIEGNEVIAIGNYAFENCDIKFVVIPDSVTNIGYDAFKYCHNLIGITIPNSVTEIEWSAFWDCDNLRSIEIPSSVTRIGSNVFANCSSLTNVYYGGTMDEWLALKCEVIHSHHFYIKGKNNKWEEVTSIEIPETFTEIPKYLLYGFSGVTSITIPSSVTKIGDSAFGGCSNLTSIVIPDSVTSIGNYAFNGCRSLASIIIPKSVTSIGTSAF
ncbi:MAG: leucine-rich repeat domain-containing protein, partial [Anaeroplasmataceae bacterium]|nr:leucine-rich repeat domain-containing protein [Anaeroplasmataceae bacterium]